MNAREFDLNIEEVLEHWGPEHAVREVIANALDESALSGTRQPVISKDMRGKWKIRDWGRGLRYEHLTQNENPEKIAKLEGIIGKFGVGLKDALATFDRQKIDVSIRSRHGDIRIASRPKHGFEELLTIHALISPPSDPTFEGTEFAFSGLTDESIERAKSFFLTFSPHTVLESTSHGQVIARGSEVPAFIYVNGLKVAEESNFLFSYNITSPNRSITRALNRERTNVGRSAYSERVKAILLQTTSNEIAERLTSDLHGHERGTIHDEMTWLDVSVHAAKLMNTSGEVLFVTRQELEGNPYFVDHARDQDLRVVEVPDTVRERLGSQLDFKGAPIRDMTHFHQEWNQSFEFKFIDEARMTLQEKDVWSRVDEILALAGGRPPRVKQILISEIMQPDLLTRKETVGLWQPSEARIVIHRSQLSSLSKLASTLLHEAIHARTGSMDLTIDFEQALTSTLGTVTAHSLALLSQNTGSASEQGTDISRWTRRRLT